MTHVVLLGDSIFDNAIYVPNGPAVIDQLSTILPQDWRASLLAVDGDVTADVEKQLENVPDDATHLVVSCGGNDALGYLPTLAERTGSIAEALDRFAVIRAEFREKYRNMLKRVLATNLEVTVCTVYDSVPDLEPSAHSALSMFNEVILKEALAAKVTVIDLRLVCSEQSDYSEVSPIEPSQKGGAKIANVIRHRVLGSDSPAGTIAIHT
jgi:hypothetical protein